MSKLIAVIFQDHTTAFEMRTDLVRMEQDHLLGIDDAVVVTRNAEGKPKLHQAMNLTAIGALNGGWWGTLIGLLFLNPLLGAVIGAGTGAMSGALTDIGVDDQFMKNVGGDLKENHAAVFVLVRDITQDRVMEGLEKYAGKGTVHTTSLSRADEEKLRAMLEAA
ncbi:DUF1269 domain-containing protein [Sulfitobacter pacificus]|uniref:Membrane protein n=1 Tax=Sulfitobacter pacificus TaxID=1499314 RepID=A0ABQ5VHL8_9RHOB|nr:DUF1269 domain-containing protein [Sulfitobacter pacificus]GLQ26594.1 membrane protein [Sulfitobacter pacificus]